MLQPITKISAFRDGNIRPVLFRSVELEPVLEGFERIANAADEALYPSVDDIEDEDLNKGDVLARKRCVYKQSTQTSTSTRNSS